MECLRGGSTSGGQGTGNRAGPSDGADLQATMRHRLVRGEITAHGHERIRTILEEERTPQAERTCSRLSRGRRPFCCFVQGGMKVCKRLDGLVMEERGDIHECR